MASERGISLLELLIVVSILGIAAAVAVPGFSSTKPYELNLAADEIAQALRFARSESMRTGRTYGVHLNPAYRRIRVFQADLSTSPATAVYNVYHPVTKKLYSLDFDTHPFVHPDSLSVVPTFRATCDTPLYIHFDLHGSAWCGTDSTVLLTNAALDITLGSETATITLDGVTGRVASP